MPTNNSRIIWITDGKAKPLLPEDDMVEPLPGSIIMTGGLHGTAWQRWFSDGLWYRTGRGSGKQWSDMIRNRNVVLVYDADERKAS